MKKILVLLAILVLFGFLPKTLYKRQLHKKEVYITMRDGVKLFTSIYIPKDISSKTNILFNAENLLFCSALW